MKGLNLKRWIFIFVVLYCGIGVWGSAEELSNREKYPPAKHYYVTAAASRIKVDGVPDEEAWQKAVKIDLPFEWDPGDNIPAPVQTECRVTFKSSHLYIAFRCFDPEPGKIRAHLMNRDENTTFVQDDHVSVMLDSFNDERRAFRFSVNPLGVQMDAVFSPVDEIENLSWDAIWHSAGKITDFGYSVEIAIPFNQLRFSKSKEKQTWGFSAERSYPRNVRHRITSHVKIRGKHCTICQFNKLTGFEGISPGRNLEFNPTLTLNRTDRRENLLQGEMETGPIKTEPGITMKWGITPNLIFNAAINQDFSHVEADAAQLEINTRFALRYPEKRPFFLENADYFLTPLEVVFTRTIFDPAWGIKTSGKIGKNALGFFLTQDRYNNLIFPSNQGSTSTSMKERVYTGIFRYRRDIGKGSMLGALYTGRTSDQYYNHVAGIDGFFRFTKSKILKFQFLGSQTQYPDEISQNFGQKAEAFAGSALFLQVRHFSRHFRYFLYYESLSPGFRADSGFIPRVDTRLYAGGINPLIWGKKGGWFDLISIILRLERVTDHNNNLAHQDIQFYASYLGPLQTVLQPKYINRKEFYKDITYDLNTFQFYFGMKPVGGMDVFMIARYGDSIDYSNARLARSVFLNSGIELGLGRHLNINLNHLYERLFLKRGKIYTANLFQTRFIYNFNVRTFIRGIVQYTHIDRDVDLYTLPTDPQTKLFFTQFLFSYKINPQTVLFIGYSDNHYGWKGVDITRTDRTFFLKIGYALAL